MSGFQTAFRVNLSCFCNQSKSLYLSRSQKPWEAALSPHRLPGAFALAGEGQVPVPISVTFLKVRTVGCKPLLRLYCSESTLMPRSLQELLFPYCGQVLRGYGDQYLFFSWKNKQRLAVNSQPPCVCFLDKLITAIPQEIATVFCCSLCR